LEPVALDELLVQPEDVLGGGLGWVRHDAQRHFVQLVGEGLEQGGHQVLLDLDGGLEVHCEPGNEFEYLCIFAILALPPADKMQVEFLLNFLGINGVPDNINKLLNLHVNLHNPHLPLPPPQHIGLDHIKHPPQYGQHLPTLDQERLLLVPGNDALKVVEHFPFGQVRDVGIVDDVVTFEKGLGVGNGVRTLTADWFLPDVDGDLDVEVRLLDVTVQEQQAACVYF
jgi:hypothetical protein